MIKRVFTQTFGAVGAIIEKEGKILLVRETQESAKDQWSHPAGWLEVGEAPLEGAIKEVKEETGFDFTPTNILGIYSFVKEEGGSIRHSVKIMFTGKISEERGEYNSEEISEIKWFLPEEIYAMDKKTLRDEDIKQMVKDYMAGKRYPLNLITHIKQI